MGMGMGMGILVLGLLLCTACTTTGGVVEEGEPVIAEEPVSQEQPVVAETVEESEQEEGEVPLVVAESEHRESRAPGDELGEVVVRARARHEVIHDLVSEAQALLSDVQLQYFFTGKGKREVLRGRPVAFALWNEAKEKWTVAQIEIPRPPVKWKPGGKPLQFTVRTPGIQARHVKGTGAERLMFAFSSGDDQLKVYGRKFPVFDSTLLKKKQWRAVVQTAKPIVYLPFTEDTFDPLFVSGGKEFLLSTARAANEELRAAGVPSAAYPAELLADVVPAEVITTLAVIEQTDDADYVEKNEAAVNEVLSQYGLKREEAYRYSVSKAAAIGPMQFTNKKHNGTYSLVVRRCPGARLDPNFERGATNLLNAMKAAICLLDIELSQMRPDIQVAYRANPMVLGIFPVAAYNGGPRNVSRLYKVMNRTGVTLEELSRPGEQPEDSPVSCPCLWKQDATGVVPVSIPKYNNENRWYVEKYQSILGLFE
jgi:Na+-transporting methylmalonyl-CoA/oxaloacetate decarboxylase gamma subunit